MAKNYARKFYKSKQWQSVRVLALKRDNYLCQHCGNSAEEVHHIKHITPENINNAAITLNLDNLVCLCRDCHHKAHKRNMKQITSQDLSFDANGNLIRTIIY